MYDFARVTGVKIPEGEVIRIAEQLSGDCTMNCVRNKRIGGLSYGTDEARKN